MTRIISPAGRQFMVKGHAFSPTPAKSMHMHVYCNPAALLSICACAYQLFFHVNKATVQICRSIKTSFVSSALLHGVGGAGHETIFWCVCECVCVYLWKYDVRVSRSLVSHPQSFYIDLLCIAHNVHSCIPEGFGPFGPLNSRLTGCCSQSGVGPDK